MTNEAMSVNLELLFWMAVLFAIGFAWHVMVTEVKHEEDKAACSIGEFQMNNEKEVERRRKVTQELIQAKGLYKAMNEWDFIPEEFTHEQALERVLKE